MAIDLVDVGGVLVEAVVAGLVLYPEEDEHTDGETDGEAADVDDGVKGVAAKVAPGGEEIVF
jgi:hypothetical protein